VPGLEPATVTVVQPGLQTTLQDVGGRAGFWDVGVPPSGAFDELTAALLARCVGNEDGAACLEAVVRGPVLRFSTRTLVAVGGGAYAATVDGRPLRPGVATMVPAGGVVDLGPLDGAGLRGYLAVRGGFAAPRVLGSRATFLLGGFGGHEGRALAAGDRLLVGRGENLAAPGDVAALLPPLCDTWELSVVAGPHGSPDYLAPGALQDWLDATWTVDHRVDRTGIRLVGPAPRWSRADGGEAGLHPSNLHDSAYPVGGIMASGDTPVIVGPDGPSLGGFVVPCVVAEADRWKLGQLRPGDTVRLRLVTPQQATAAAAERRRLLADVGGALDLPVGGGVARPAVAAVPPAVPAPVDLRPDLLLARDATATSPAVSVRWSGERHLLVEAGPDALDLTVRVWIHLLAERLRQVAPQGIQELVEGVRSILVKVDPARTSVPRMVGAIGEALDGLPDPAGATFAVREVTLPLALDDPRAHEAMRRYQASVRPDAPWCPDNVEFIRRVNDLDTRDEVFDIVRAATYLVVGLGDVYLGAPVAVPLDPRHRLVTTKYDPARTWTPENAVGIGGVYLCVYGMEGPGGYQLVGRTVPVWRRPGTCDRDPVPWLLRPFDRLRFEAVSAEELLERRAAIKAGTEDLVVRPATFSLHEVAALEEQHAAQIAGLRSRRRAAFDAERGRWAETARARREEAA
jgi:urea carboxylase